MKDTLGGRDLLKKMKLAKNSFSNSLCQPFIRIGYKLRTKKCLSLKHYGTFNDIMPSAPNIDCWFDENLLFYISSDATKRKIDRYCCI